MGTEEFEEALKATEIKLSRLRSLYEQWFAGIERIEPGVARKDLERMIEALKREQPRNTALRFRMQQLIARYGTYGLYWTRIAKQIEDGTYRRDLQRLKARQTRKDEAREETFEFDVEVDSSTGIDTGLDFDSFGDSDLDAILGALTSAPPAKAEPKSFSRPASKDVHTASTPLPPRPAPAPSAGPLNPPKPPLPPPRAGLGARGPVPMPPPPAATGPQQLARIQRPPTPATGGVREAAGTHSRSAPPLTRGVSNPASGDEMRTLYDRYLDARKQNNERVDNVKFETLQTSVEKMLPKLREKHAGKQIEFEVVVQDGKVGLKPKVRG